MRYLAAIDYHRARAAAEMERSAQTPDPLAAALHRQLAELHLLSADESQDLHAEAPDAANAARSVTA
jgi:hypothetical protein